MIVRISNLRQNRVCERATCSHGSWSPGSVELRTHAALAISEDFTLSTTQDEQRRTTPTASSTQQIHRSSPPPWPPPWLGSTVVSQRSDEEQFLQPGLLKAAARVILEDFNTWMSSKFQPSTSIFNEDAQLTRNLRLWSVAYSPYHVPVIAGYAHNAGVYMKMWSIHIQQVQNRECDFVTYIILILLSVTTFLLSLVMHIMLVFI